jgi:hypothetical protein
MFDTKKYRNNYLKNTALYYSLYQEKNTKRPKTTKNNFYSGNNAFKINPFNN